MLENNQNNEGYILAILERAVSSTGDAGKI